MKYGVNMVHLETGELKTFKESSIQARQVTIDVWRGMGYGVLEFFQE